MVECCQLIEVGITSLGIAAVEALGQLQHIIGIARFRTIDIVDEVGACIFAWEMLTTTVTTESQRSLTGDDVPEVCACGMVGLVAAEFTDTLKSHDFWHLGIGMHIVEAVLSLRHRCEQSTMRESACHFQVFLLPCHGIGICEHLVHAPMLIVKHSLHLCISKGGCKVNGPVAEA